MALELRILGALEVLRDGEPVRLAGRMRRSLEWGGRRGIGCRDVLRSASRSPSRTASAAFGQVALANRDAAQAATCSEPRTRSWWRSAPGCSQPSSACTRRLVRHPRANSATRDWRAHDGRTRARGRPGGRLRPLGDRRDQGSRLSKVRIGAFGLEPAEARRSRRARRLTRRQRPPLALRRAQARQREHDREQRGAGQHDRRAGLDVDLVAEVHPDGAAGRADHGREDRASARTSRSASARRPPG